MSLENEYLKKVIDINKPILETEKEKILHSIIKVVGNKAEKVLRLPFLLKQKIRLLIIKFAYK